MSRSRCSPAAVIRAARAHAGEILSAALVRAAVRARLTMRVDGVRVRVSSAAMARSLWRDRHVYDEDLTFYRRFLRAGDVVVDVGANIGLTTLTAARVAGPTGRVVAVEPHPRRRRIVEYPGDDSQNRLAAGDQGDVEVAVVTLDRLLTLDRLTVLLKLDVEGYEKFVLDGAARTLAVTGCVYFESWEPHFVRYGYTGRDLLDALRARGFRLYRARGPALQTLRDDHRSPECENLVAVKDVQDFLDRTGYRLGPGGS